MDDLPVVPPSLLRAFQEETMSEQLKSQLKDQVESRLVQLGQGHILRFWDDLNDQQQTALANQIAGIDFALLERLKKTESVSNHWADLAARANVPPAITLQDFSNPESLAKAEAIGRQTLEQGHVGMILVAGGQGSRLGFDHPKGMFPIGPVSNRTLYQIHFEKVLARSRQFGRSIPIYVMTSPPTHEETTNFLAEHRYFGVEPDNVMIFCQGTMPAVDHEGKLLLSDKGTIFVSPDGHGGMLAAFEKSGCLRHARDRGIEHLFYGQVDNPLIQICEPSLVGYHIQAQSEMTSQVVRKTEPTQKVGNVVEVDGKVQIIEYSDLPEQFARQVSEDGSLKLWAGSIAVHIFTVDFLQRALEQADSLPFHRANKKVSYINEFGDSMVPAEPNATKFEKFIFDLLPSANNAIVCEVDPAEGFCAVKNAAPAPAETPAHVKQAISDQHRRWLEASGVTVAAGVDVEINPLFAPDVETLRTKVQPGTSVDVSTYFI